MLLLWFVLERQLKRLHNGAPKWDPLPLEREEKPPKRRRPCAHPLPIFPRPWKGPGLFTEVTRREEDQRQAKLGRLVPKQTVSFLCQPLLAPVRPSQSRKNGEESEGTGRALLLPRSLPLLRPGATANSELPGRAAHSSHV